MYQRARYKLDIDDKVIQAGRFDNKSTQEEQEEFLVSRILNDVAVCFTYVWNSALYTGGRSRGIERRSRRHE